MKKKVLQLLHGFSMGGAETLVKEYCLKLNKEKYDISVLCFYRYGTPYEKILEDAGIEITYIDDFKNREAKTGLKRVGVLGEYIRRYYFIRDYIQNKSPDIIHSHLAVNSYVAFAKPKKGTRILHTVHNEPKRIWKNTFSRRVDLKAAHKLVKDYQMQFITLHEDMNREVNEIFGVADSQVLNNGIDFVRFENVISGKEVRKREGIPEDAYVVGHIGRFGKQKNHKFLIEIFERIKEEKKNAYLLLIGNGALRQEIEDQLKAMGLADSFQILSNRSDIPELLAAMDVFVFPSIYEGLGIVLIEAQKMERKCVISEAVPNAVIVSNLVKKLDLTLPAREWAKEIIGFEVEKTIYNKIDEWDMNCVVSRLEEIYG